MMNTTNIYLYVTTSIIVSLCFTFASMYTYHWGFKKLVMPSAVFFKGTTGIIAYDLQTYIELFGIYLVTTLCTAWIFSKVVVFILLLTICGFFWFIFYVNTWWELHKRYYKDS